MQVKLEERLNYMKSVPGVAKGHGIDGELLESGHGYNHIFPTIEKSLLNPGSPGRHPAGTPRPVACSKRSP